MTERTEEEQERERQRLAADAAANSGSNNGGASSAAPAPEGANAETQEGSEGEAQDTATASTEITIRGANYNLRSMTPAQLTTLSGVMENDPTYGARYAAIYNLVLNYDTHIAVENPNNLSFGALVSAINGGSEAMNAPMQQLLANVTSAVAGAAGNVIASQQPSNQQGQQGFNGWAAAGTAFGTALDIVNTPVDAWNALSTTAGELWGAGGRATMSGAAREERARRIATIYTAAMMADAEGENRATMPLIDSPFNNERSLVWSYMGESLSAGWSWVVANIPFVAPVASFFAGVGAAVKSIVDGVMSGNFDFGRLWETAMEKFAEGQRESDANIARNRGRDFRAILEDEISQNDRRDAAAIVRAAGVDENLTNLIANGGVFRDMDGNYQLVGNNNNSFDYAPAPGASDMGGRIGNQWMNLVPGAFKDREGNFSWTGDEENATIERQGVATAMILGAGYLSYKMDLHGRLGRLIGLPIKSAAQAINPFSGRILAHMSASFNRGYAEGRGSASPQFNNKVRRAYAKVAMYDARIDRATHLRDAAQAKLDNGNVTSRGGRAYQERVIAHQEKRIANATRLRGGEEAKLIDTAKSRASVVLGRGPTTVGTKLVGNEKKLSDALARLGSRQDVELQRHPHRRRVDMSYAEINGRLELIADGVPVRRGVRQNLQFAANADDLASALNTRLTAQAGRSTTVINRLTALQGNAQAGALSAEINRALTAQQSALNAVQEARSSAERANAARLAAEQAQRLSAQTPSDARLRSDAVDRLRAAEIQAETARVRLDQAIDLQRAADLQVRNLHVESARLAVVDARGVYPALDADVARKVSAINGETQRLAVDVTANRIASTDPVLARQTVAGLDRATVAGNPDLVRIIDSDMAPDISPQAASGFTDAHVRDIPTATLANMTTDALQTIPTDAWTAASAEQIHAVKSRLPVITLIEIARNNPDAIRATINNDILRGRSSEDIVKLINGLDSGQVADVFRAERLAFIDAIQPSTDPLDRRFDAGFAGGPYEDMRRNAQPIVDALLARNPDFFFNMRLEDIQRLPNAVASAIPDAEFERIRAANPEKAAALEARSSRRAARHDLNNARAQNAEANGTRAEANGTRAIEGGTAHGTNADAKDATTAVAAAEEALHAIRETRSVWGGVDKVVGGLGHLCGWINRVPYVGDALFFVGVGGACIAGATAARNVEIIQRLVDMGALSPEDQIAINSHNAGVVADEGVNAAPLAGIVAGACTTAGSEGSYRLVQARLRECGFSQEAIDDMLMKPSLTAGAEFVGGIYNGAVNLVTGGGDRSEEPTQVATTEGALGAMPAGLEQASLASIEAARAECSRLAASLSFGRCDTTTIGTYQVADVANADGPLGIGAGGDAFARVGA
ncbi:MAG: hypothetical protein J0M34_07685 [Alphaproteobacteria bacterium]|nr:hypothetical protein [Alphaproteobacteria bacterium]